MNPIKAILLSSRLIVVTLPLTSVVSGDLKLSVSPGVGLFEVGLSFLEVGEFENGYSVKYHLDPSNPEARLPHFSAMWSTDGWTEIVFDRFTYHDSARTIFAPFGKEGGVPVYQGAIYYLPPKLDSARDFYGLHFFAENCFNVCNSLDFDVEFSVLETPAPLPGDFNVDDLVDIDDFEILARNFNSPSFIASSWQEGDATLDGKVRFDDFLVLSTNFGAAREPQLAVVPEPSSLALFGLAFYGLSRWRRSPNIAKPNRRRFCYYVLTGTSKFA